MKSDIQEGEDYLEKGAELARIDDAEGARPYLEYAVRMQPGSAMHHYNLARDYLLLNYLEPCLFHYNAAVLLDPDHDQNEVSKANIGHISKILKVDMDAWNEVYGARVKAFADGAFFNDGDDDSYDYEDDSDDSEDGDVDDDVRRAQDEL